MVGPIIPPSVIMVIYAAVAQVSVIELFLAGFVPGLLPGPPAPSSSTSRPRRRPAEPDFARRAPGGAAAAGRRSGVHPAAVHRGGTLSGAFTATEAGGIAVVYARSSASSCSATSIKAAVGGAH